MRKEEGDTPAVTVILSWGVLEGIPEMVRVILLAQCLPDLWSWLLSAETLPDVFSEEPPVSWSMGTQSSHCPGTPHVTICLNLTHAS